jgi:epoxyqueuosine reductase
MPIDIENQILSRAREIGASLAGIADMNTLKKSPSYGLLSSVGTRIDGLYANFETEGFEPPEWPKTVKSILVIALSHPITDPQMDWFYKRGYSPGNNKLLKINKELSLWIEKDFQIKTHPMSYYVGKGGIYLKDAAVLAGLGCLGKNNLLVTPEYGPRVRLRAMLLEAELKTTGPVEFDPCENCPGYCRKVCPQEAFAGKVQFPSGIDIVTPPARDGHFLRSKCMFQMDTDRAILDDSDRVLTNADMDEQKVYQSPNPAKLCRLCEFTCPVGS